MPGLSGYRAAMVCVEGAWCPASVIETKLLGGTTIYDTENGCPASYQFSLARNGDQLSYSHASYMLQSPSAGHSGVYDGKAIMGIVGLF